MSDGTQRFPIPRASVTSRATLYNYNAGSWTSHGTYDVPEFDIYGDSLNLDNLSPEEYRKLFKFSGWCPNVRTHESLQQWFLTLISTYSWTSMENISSEESLNFPSSGICSSSEWCCSPVHFSYSLAQVSLWPSYGKHNSTANSHKRYRLHRLSLPSQACYGDWVSCRIEGKNFRVWFANRRVVIVMAVHKPTNDCSYN